MYPLYTPLLHTDENNAEMEGAQYNAALPCDSDDFIDPNKEQTKEEKEAEEIKYVKEVIETDAPYYIIIMELDMGKDSIRLHITMTRTANETEKVSNIISFYIKLLLILSIHLYSMIYLKYLKYRNSMIQLKFKQIIHHKIYLHHCRMVQVAPYSKLSRKKQENHENTQRKKFKNPGVC